MVGAAALAFRSRPSVTPSTRSEDPRGHPDGHRAHRQPDGRRRPGSPHYIGTRRGPPSSPGACAPRPRRARTAGDSRLIAGSSGLSTPRSIKRSIAVDCPYQLGSQADGTSLIGRVTYPRRSSTKYLSALMHGLDRATAVPVAQSDVGYARPLGDPFMSTVEIHAVVGRRFASRSLGFRFP